jgi:PAS domain S-box-containing protein
MRLLIVDDHEVVRRGVRSLLSEQAGWDVCGEAVDGQDAVEKGRELRPDLIVMDVSMPRLNGLEATRQLRSVLPQCEVLILSQHENNEMARQAFRAGARGYVVKSAISRDLISAVAKASRHEYFFDPAVLDQPPGAHTDVEEILQRSAAFEHALRQSEQLYRSTFEMAGLGIAHISPDGRCLRVNRKLCEILGYSEPELLSLTLQDIIHPDDLEADLSQREKVRSEALGSYSGEKRCIRKDGSLVWINLTVAAVRDSGKLEYFVCVIDDISAGREAEEAQFRLGAIVEASDDAIVSKKLDGVITSWNPAATRIFGFKAEEAIGRSITIIIPPDLRHEEATILSRLRRGERIEHYETVRMTKGGKELNVSLTISPVRDSKGHIIGASKIARDITERKQAEQSRNLLAAIVDSSDDAIVSKSLDGIITSWNKSAERIFGYSAEEAIGQHITLIIPPEHHAEESEILTRLGRGERVDHFHTVRRRKDGTLLDVSLTISPVRDSSGRVIGASKVARDITAQKRVAEKVRVADEAVRLMKAQDEERRRIARDFHDSAGQTLTVLGLSVAQLVQEAEVVAPELAEKGRHIEEVIQQLHREIRTTSYLLHPPLLDEAGLSSALNWYVQGLTERSGMKIDLNISDDFGRLPAEMELAIFRVVQECLTNIHRHAESKTAYIRIARENGRVCAEVRDEGKGMSPERLAEIESRGSGVGIAGIRERLRHFGGTMKIESDDTGTRVLTGIPLTTIASSAESAQLQPVV